MTDDTTSVFMTQTIDAQQQTIVRGVGTVHVCYDRYVLCVLCYTRRCAGDHSICPCHIMTCD
jgi:hypothetical protein